MKKSDFNQSVSAHVFLSDYVHKDGSSTVYLRITVDRKKREFNLNESWPQACFNKKSESAEARHAKDADVERVNMIIAEAKGRANKIKLRYFADGRKLSLAGFEREFINYMSSDNFMFYWKTKQLELVNDKVITEDTSDNHTTSYNRIVEFLGGEEFLPFYDIDINLVQKLNAWIRKTKGLGHNTACTTHKTFRAYINRALNDKYKFDNPYKSFKYSFREAERDVLERTEIRKLEKLYEQKKLDELGQEVLAKFLFSCYTGIRISDSGLIKKEMIRGGKLKIALKKGFNFGKMVNILLPDFALKILEGRKGLLFKAIADQTCNKYLKIIAAKARVNKELTFHVSRDTFGTEFINLGGDVYTLMLLMGHSDIRTTMIYVKLSEKRQDKQMRNFNKL